MAYPTPIEWTDATWNPVRGCTRITLGCGGPNHEGGCYAEKMAARFSDPGQPYHGFAERTPHGGRWTGKVALIEDQLMLPLRWKKPRRIFVNSMSDLFHENLPDEAIDKVFAVMALCPQHTFQVLTKRAERMREYLNNCQGNIWDAWARLSRGRPNRVSLIEGQPIVKTAPDWPLPNVWLGVSCERQQEADERIPYLLRTPAAIRFVSAEPLLGPIDLDGWLGKSSCGYCDDGGGFAPPRCGRDDVPRHEQCPDKRAVFVEREIGPYDKDGAPTNILVDRRRLDQVITGGETGGKARPMHPQWPRDIRDQCEAADVAFFHKQNGEFRECELRGDNYAMTRRETYIFPESGGSFRYASNWTRKEGGIAMERVGKKAAGRLLDGVAHNGFPRVAAIAAGAAA
jgi:protein gp37